MPFIVQIFIFSWIRVSKLLKKYYFIEQYHRKSGSLDLYVEIWEHVLMFQIQQFNTFCENPFLEPWTFYYYPYKFWLWVNVFLFLSKFTVRFCKRETIFGIYVKDNFSISPSCGEVTLWPKKERVCNFINFFLPFPCNVTMYELSLRMILQQKISEMKWFC